MRRIIGGILGFAVLALMFVAAQIGGWSPLNLIFGPQYQERPQSGGDSRMEFVAETVPQLYPKLVASLKANGAERVRWMTQSGETQEQLVMLKGAGLEIETSTFTGASPSNAEFSPDPMIVEMRDSDLDGLMDMITYTEPSGRTHTYKAPFDDTSQYLWDTALAITFRSGKCCQ